MNKVFENIKLNSIEIIKQYPFFQSAYLLSNTENHTSLNTISIHLSDRKKLYKKIYKDIVKEVVHNIESQHITNLSTEKNSTVENKVIDELEKLVLEEVVNQAASFDIEKEYGKTASTVPVEEENKKNDNLNSNDKKEVKNIISKTKESSAVESITTFSAWLKTLNNVSKQNKEKVTTKENNSNSENKESRRNDIIDSFIKKQPKIEKPKQSFFSPKKMGEMSLLDNEEFVTETLAKIYVKQGAFEKAIKAYETLSLKYPKKKTFFAAQILDLKNQIENK